MKTVEKLLWATGMSALAAGTAYSIANYDETQVFDKSKPAVVTSVTETHQGPGFYVNGVFYEDRPVQAHADLRQCAEQNPVLKDCKTYSLTITDEQVADFAIGQVVTVENVKTDS